MYHVDKYNVFIIIYAYRNYRIYIFTNIKLFARYQRQKTRY